MAKEQIYPTPPGPPDVCTIAESAGNFQIATNFQACPLCNPSAAALWDGKWIPDAGVTCIWHPDVTSGTRIGDKNIHRLGQHSYLWLDIPTEAWRVHIECELGGFVGLDTWTGQKLHGPTAAGLYARVSGCDLTGNRIITAIP